MKYKVLFGLLLASASLNVKAADPKELLDSLYYLLGSCNHELTACTAYSAACTANSVTNANMAALQGFGYGCCLATSCCIGCAFLRERNAGIAQAPGPISMAREEGVDNSGAEQNHVLDPEERRESQLRQLSRRVNAAAASGKADR